MGAEVTAVIKLLKSRWWNATFPPLPSLPLPHLFPPPPFPSLPPPLPFPPLPSLPLEVGPLKSS